MSVKRQMARNRMLSATERVSNLEQDLEMVIEEINKLSKSIEAISYLHESTAEVLNAVTEVVDSVKVAEVLTRKRLEKATEQMENVKAQLLKDEQEGRMVRMDTITANSLIVGKETDKNGQVPAPGQITIPFIRLKPQYQEKLLGQGVGFVTEMEDGGKFEVLEVWKEVTPEPSTAPATPN